MSRDKAGAPPGYSLIKTKQLAKGCTACPLYKKATQTVFGEGDAHAAIMIVGEQPGNLEDLQGHPFVGPAGGILEKALEAAGLARQDVYLTNAVKHFKWEPRGKTRLHKKPSGPEIKACRPWLENEIQKVNPRVILALGVTAGNAVLGRPSRIGAERGKALESKIFAPMVMLSWHPSAILRSRTHEEREAKLKELIQDLKRAAAAVRRRQKSRANPSSSPTL